MSCEEFLQLSVQELSDILGRDDLNVRKESTVYDAVLRWIAHIPKQREQHISVLLSKVRLTLTSEQYIRNNVISHPLVKDNSECLQIASNSIAIIGHFLRHRRSLVGVCNQLVRHRLPKVILLAIGGWSDDNSTNGIEAYDIRANCWINVENGLGCPRAYHGAVFLNGHVYCVGGYNGGVFYNNLDRFDLSTRTWHELTPMHRRRCNVSVTVLNGCIYAMGGKDRDVRLSSAERYRPEINQWSRIAPMNEPRSCAGCATLHNKVYICGGCDGIDRLQTAECYNPETDQWTEIAPMSVSRSGVGVIAYSDRVFAVGGFDGNTCLQSAEAYNPQTNTWHTVSSMLTPRSNFGLEVIEDRLFVVGGYDGNIPTNYVEFYDAARDEWSEACDMAIDRNALSCCVVSGLSNLTSYIIPRDTLPPLTLEDELEASS
nr:kelch-like protein 10 [Monopterus albus]